MIVAIVSFQMPKVTTPTIMVVTSFGPIASGSSKIVLKLSRVGPKKISRV